ncbi:hypothetical protein C8Q77DRAFT_1276186 [Trametes polyzona]|nr:hypothetical protein C8Q77DRAFT_1276186 [Trametes polyzona]
MLGGPTTRDQPIVPLPSSTQSRLRSTQILTSLPQLVSELIQNALDAGARTVDVSLDPEEWECSVRDDGHGIPRDGLAILTGGPQDGRYGTSKAYSPASLDDVSTFGFRGEALASAADISCLEISTRTAHARESWSVIVKGGQTLYSGPSTRWRREYPGTVVYVRDVFYNLPIRRRSHPNTLRTIEIVKRDIEAFALIFPGVSFSLESSRLTKECTYTRSKARILSVPRTASTLTAFRHIYGRALADHVEEVDESGNNMRIQGFLSLQGTYSKAYQFLYINRHFLAPCDLHRQIEAVFARSSFGKNALDELGRTLTSSARRSPRKTEKKPIYVLNLTIAPRYIDNCVEPAKAAVQLRNSADAAALLSAVIERFLDKHGFLLARSENFQPLGNTSSPRKRRKLNSEKDPAGPPQGRVLSPPRSQLPLEGVCELQLMRPKTAPDHTSKRLPTTLEDGVVAGGVEDTSHMLWTDPTTGERFVIDGRTGNSYPQVAPTAPTTTDAPTATPARRARMTLASSSLVPTKADAPAWIAQVLNANEAYRLAERKIASVPSCAELMNASACSHGRHAPTNPSWDAPRLGRFTGADLRGARVLGQVDRKFIACVLQASPTTLPSPPGERSGNEEAQGDDDTHHGSHDGRAQSTDALVLIDQHAAHERVRVERFLRELCECEPSDGGRIGAEVGRSDVVGVRGRTRALVPPATVLLTGREARSITHSRDVRAAFALWGVAFAAPCAAEDTRGRSDEGEAAYAQVEVTSIPEVVADKLLGGDELRDLIKGYLGKLEEDGVEGILQGLGSGNFQDDQGLRGWQRALRYCPRELVDLVNSKACRGAIMFNDVLTHEQCKKLLEELSETALPFQCAHGRPSLVPLIDVDGPATFSVGAAVDWSTFAGARRA